MPLDNRVAIVTGAARGIGLAIARRFLEEGARVMIVDIDGKGGEKALAELAPLGEVAFHEGDVAERLDVRNVVAATLEAFGDIDILVNNAGVAAKGDFLELGEEEFDAVLRVNLKGTFLMSQAAARHMVERVSAGGAPGSIINMSSVDAVFALADQVPYSASKAGINQLTKAMALSLAAHGIRVNAIGPGSISTEMLDLSVGDEEMRRRLLSRIPLGRFGDPREIAALVAFLASDEASYVTGEIIYADGGRLPLSLTVPVNE
ncbi:MAG: 3-oxoacyl-ACP reductase FabG [Bauldia sp.]|nr:3-oxoacyl-ACP reductase FabG [Bauldia sp.]